MPEVCSVYLSQCWCLLVPLNIPSTFAGPAFSISFPEIAINTVSDFSYTCAVLALVASRQDCQP